MMRPFFLTEFWRGVKVNKSGIHVVWILAYARMTAGGVSQAVGFFTGGNASRF